MLPQIEHRVLFDSVNFDFAGYDTAGTPLLENQTVRRASVALFLCPSDGEVNHRVNYRFNRGIWQRGAQDYGPFAPFFTSTQASITDGLSRTAFMSERLGGDFVQGSRDVKRNFIYSTEVDAPSMTIEDDFVAPCISSADRVWLPFTGRYWFYNGDPFTYYHHLGRPDDDRPSCFSHYERHWGILGFAPPRSNHLGSVNVLYGDGHVEPALDSIDQRVWRALGTPRGGE
jgi:prepilin-type processing-associated H-X9-DG protein